MQEWYNKDTAKRKKILLHLKDEEGLYEELSNVLFNFIKEKVAPFPHACNTQADFWMVPSWKRAMVHVFGMRFALDKHATKQWKLNCREDWEFTRKCFARYMAKDKAIFAKCSKLKKLPPGGQCSTGKLRKRRRAQRRANRFTPSPVKKKKKVVSKVVIDLFASSEDEDNS